MNTQTKVALAVGASVRPRTLAELPRMYQDYPGWSVKPDFEVLESIAELGRSRLSFLPLDRPRSPSPRAGRPNKRACREGKVAAYEELPPTSRPEPNTRQGHGLQDEGSSARAWQLHPRASRPRCPAPMPRRGLEAVPRTAEQARRWLGPDPSQQPGAHPRPGAAGQLAN